jgi:hypothetical protein
MIYLKLFSTNVSYNTSVKFNFDACLFYIIHALFQAETKPVDFLSNISKYKQNKQITVYRLISIPTLLHINRDIKKYKWLIHSWLICSSDSFITMFTKLYIFGLLRSSWFESPLSCLISYTCVSWQFPSYFRPRFCNHFGWPAPGL